MKNTDFLEDITTEIDRHIKEINSISAHCSEIFIGMRASKLATSRGFTDTVKQNYELFAHQSTMRHLQVLRGYFSHLVNSGSEQQVEAFIDSLIQLMNEQIEAHENRPKNESETVSEIYANLLKSSNYVSCKMLHAFLISLKNTHF